MSRLAKRGMSLHDLGRPSSKKKKKSRPVPREATCWGLEQVEQAVAAVLLPLRPAGPARFPRYQRGRHRLLLYPQRR
jgi:hypothetical protein